MVERAHFFELTTFTLLLAAGCAREGARVEPETLPPVVSTKATPPSSEPTVADTPTPEPAAKPAALPPAKPAAIGCWEREFGKPPAENARGPSLPGKVDGCEGCETLRVGPNAAGLHVEVLRRVQKTIETLPAPEVDEPVMWINSGKRTGDLDDSMHNQGLAIDAVICGLDTRATGERLRKAGFTCVIEYYDGAGNPCHFAHADLRTHEAAVGAYAKGGRKARTCPKKAKSRTMDCSGSSKRDWTYSEG